MGRKKKSNKSKKIQHPVSNESTKTPAEVKVGEAPEAIEYDSSKLILDEFLHEAVQKLPSHVDERERSATVSTLGSEIDGERYSIDMQTGTRRDSERNFDRATGISDLLPDKLEQDSPVFFDAQSEPAVSFEVGPGDDNAFIIECNDNEDESSPPQRGEMGKHKSVSFKENLISEEIMTAASDPTMVDLGERRVSFAEDEMSTDIDGNCYFSDPTAPLITRDMIGGEEDEGEKMVNSFIASASAKETIVEEDRVTWKAPLVQTIMRELSARCCCSKQVRFQDN